MIWLLLLLYGLGTIAIVVTVLPLWRTTRWWVRICDFPRLQIAVLVAAVLMALAFLSFPNAIHEWAFAATLLIALCWQTKWVWRYLPGAPREVRSCENRGEDSNRLTLVTTNVLQTARSADRLLEIITQLDTDLILAVETDEWWCSRLRDGLVSRFTYAVTYPLSTGYGLSLFSRLELVDPSIRFVVDEAIPSIKTGVRLRSGAVIDLYGVHPKPPSVRQDSTERDLELVRIAMEVERSDRPAVVLGDLNDVAWSASTAQFTRTGHLRDPRRGRGFFNTYPAALPGLRYPLDYVFHTAHFGVSEMRVLPRFGSDHLPLLVSLCLTDPEPIGAGTTEGVGSRVLHCTGNRFD